MAAKIVNGRWTRKLKAAWGRNGMWRTDIFKSTLADPRLVEAEFVLPNGRRIVIPAAGLRRILIGGRDHYNGKIWGPFNIEPAAKTVEGQSCSMKII
jgi:hypothetical protein